MLSETVTLIDYKQKTTIIQELKTNPPNQSVKIKDSHRDEIQLLLKNPLIFINEIKIIH